MDSQPTDNIPIPSNDDRMMSSSNDDKILDLSIGDRLMSHQVISSSVISSAGISSKPYEYLTQIDIEQLNTNTELLRQAYEQVFTDQSNIYQKTNPNYWKEELHRAATLIIKEMIDTHPGGAVSASNTVPLTIAFNGHMYSFENSNHILIGRYPNCDVEVKGIFTVSRLHAIIFPIQAINKYLVVDVGSLLGINTVKRSSAADKINSVPKKRMVLMFDWNEVAVLDLGGAIICINPRECVICYNKPREVTLGCGHYVVCNDCLPKILLCPLCRNHITDHQIGYHLASNVPN